MNENTPPCILIAENGRRDLARRRSMTLGEECPVALTCPPTAEQIREVVRWMDVEKSARWQPTGGATYCNIYATDLLHLIYGLRDSGRRGYIPRVWWTDPEKATAETKPVYAKNCREMSANSLTQWMRDYGPQFGWELHETRPTLDKNDVAVVIGAAHKGHGHIQVVLSWGATQAGSTNFEVRDEPYSDSFWRSYKDFIWAVCKAEPSRDIA